MRAAAPQAKSIAELPAPRDVLGRLAQALGIEGADHGYAEARAAAGAVVIERD